MNTHSHEAGFGTATIIGVIAAVALIGGFVFTSQHNDEARVANDMEQKELVHEEKSMDKRDAAESMMKDTDAKMMDDDKNMETADAHMEDSMKKMEKDTMMSEVADNGIMIEKDAEIDTAFLPEQAPGEFIEYADGSLAYAETGDVLLFFHASWCPSCRGLEKDINANLNAIPDGVSIQKVDYDTEVALKQKYGVVRQHTLVHVDKEGNEIKTLTGLTNTLDQVVAQI